MGSFTSGRIENNDAAPTAMRAKLAQLYGKLNKRTDQLNAAYALIVKLRTQLAIERERRERLEERLQ